MGAFIIGVVLIFKTQDKVIKEKGIVTEILSDNIPYNTRINRSNRRQDQKKVEQLTVRNPLVRLHMTTLERQIY